MAGAIIPEITEADVQSLLEFIRNSVADAGSDGAVIGISGGIDSAVVTKLCVDALGHDKVMCVFMPTGVTSDDDRRVTGEMCSDWGCEYRVVDIQPAVEALLGTMPSESITPLVRGNTSARCRMAVLYNLAKVGNRLVMGTTNLSEQMMGYFTKFGDSACDVAPMANMYKTEVWQVAAMIGVPREVIDKPPSAGLWEGQTDESEMGIRYADLDAVLYLMECGMDDSRVSAETGVSESKVADIRRRSVSMEHKRKLPFHPSDFRSN